jgi:hypothetical protein
MEEQDRPVLIEVNGDVSGEFSRYFYNYGGSGASNANVAQTWDAVGEPNLPLVLPLFLISFLLFLVIPSLFPIASVVTDYNMISCGSCHLPEMPERLYQHCSRI